MKVTLFALNSSYAHTNLAIRCLRVPLTAAGFTVELVELNLRDMRGQALRRLYESNADIYGFSCYIWNIREMLSLAADLRALRPESKIVFGGPEISFGQERFTADKAPFIDLLISHAGEGAMLQCCLDFREGKTPERFCDGRCFPYAEELCDPAGLYLADDPPMGTTLYYESSRGCPFRCAYCLSSVSGGVTMKSAEETLADLLAFEALDREFHVIKFVDRTFNCDRERADRIWEGLLDERYTKKYQFEICADLLTEKSYEILSRFPKGKVQLEIGLQSTNRETLSAVARHTDPDRVLAASQRLRAAGNIHVHLDLIAGLPYETYARFGRSFDDAYPACDLLQLGFLKLLHGTALRRDSEIYGIKAEQEPPYTVLETKWISYAELARLHEISDLVERYRDGKGFLACLPYALSCVGSPFAFYEGLLDTIAKLDGRPIRKIGQPDAYGLLYRYVSTLDGIDLAHFEELLHADFAANEHKKFPSMGKKQDITKT